MLPDAAGVNSCFQPKATEAPLSGQRKDERATERSEWHHQPEKDEASKQCYSADPRDTMDATGVGPVENPEQHEKRQQARERQWWLR